MVFAKMLMFIPRQLVGELLFLSKAISRKEFQILRNKIFRKGDTFFLEKPAKVACRHMVFHAEKGLKNCQPLINSVKALILKDNFELSVDITMVFYEHHVPQILSSLHKRSLHLAYLSDPKTSIPQRKAPHQKTVITSSFQSFPFQVARMPCVPRALEGTGHNIRKAQVGRKSR
jgi:hypothetical protein